MSEPFFLFCCNTVIQQKLILGRNLILAIFLLFMFLPCCEFPPDLSAGMLVMLLEMLWDKLVFSS